MTDEERDHQINVLSLILGATIGALLRLGYLTGEEASAIERIVKRMDVEAKDS